ncbi:periplasmic heavy metal sensor [Saccharicrinis sp. FJH54]|uniref:periplasmic heavy metal sensor n=1 Tax=Saccharicrinis sp. FJH54 TaxID=3344665 RepID=UPI0035D4DB42
MKTKQIIPLALGLLLTGTFMVQAQNFNKRGPNTCIQNGPMAGQGRGQNFGAAQFADCPALSDEQKATLKSLQDDHRTEVQKLRLDLEAKKAKQKTLVEAASPDVKAIDKNIDEMAKLQAQLSKSNASFRVEVQKILPGDCPTARGQRNGQGYGPAKMNGQQGRMGKGNGQGRGNGQFAGPGNGQHQGPGFGPGNGQGFNRGMAGCGQCTGQGFNRGMAVKGGSAGKGFHGNGMGMRNGMAQGQNFRGGMKGGNRAFAGHGNGVRQGSGMRPRVMLSEETKELLQKNMLAVSAQTRDLRNQMNELQVKQKTLMAEDKIDLKNVNKNIDEMAKLRAQIMKTRVNAQIDLLKQLSPDEKEKVLLSKPLMQGQGRGFRI